MVKNYDALALLSGGLDSILAMKVVQKQGLNVLGLHFVSPFFGKPDKLDHWRAIYSLDIEMVPIGPEYVKMMVDGPTHGYGKVLNPCIDCKILMLSKAKELLPKYNAKFLISGEVIGQRPMSQRKDALNIIRRDAIVKDILLRPLCAKHLDPTPMEQSGLVDREQLLSIWGRGRKEQIRLAKEFGITEIPQPAGGCRLTDKDAAKRYKPIFTYIKNPTEDDFLLANVGRQFWNEGYWLVIGRNQEDNEKLRQMAKDTDILFELQDIPGPTGLARPIEGYEWDEKRKKEASKRILSYTPKADHSTKIEMK